MAQMAVAPESVFEAPIAAPAQAFVPPAPVFEPAPVAVRPVAPTKRAPRPRAAAGSKGKAAFTLRLDNERHLRRSVRNRDALLTE